MKVAIYSRISTLDQNAAMQITELTQYAESRGWRIVARYCDRGWSGSKSNRPEYLQCIADAEGRKFDCVLVWKLDRWGRSLIDMVESIRRLESAGVRFIAIQSGIDTDKNNPAARLILHLFASFAEYERELIRERVAAGLRQYQTDFANGKAVSHTGKNLPVGRPRKVFDRSLAKTMRDTGLSYQAISRNLGVPVATVHAAMKTDAES